MAMTPEEQAIADDFEKGWSPERLDAAEVNWGPGFTDILPHALDKQIHQRAENERIGDLHLIRTVLERYFLDTAA